MKKILFLLFLSSRLISQDDLYKKADSIALNFHKNKYDTYEETAMELTENLTSEKEKCRVIFRWITDAISYDHEKKSDYHLDDATAVFKKKKTLSAGFSILFTAMCEEAKIKSRTITGEAACKDCYHVWNIVKLDGQWYNLDLTWAAGYTKNVYSIKLKKHYNNEYWLQDIETFKKDHSTSDPDWNRMFINNITTAND